ncbi:DNA-binding protein [Sulfolobus acidocaldarius SUSAZ]|nr:DNA-binding protein [Sulfolobus acidocaldarius SUSAZ]
MFEEIKKKYQEMFGNEKLPYLKCTRCGHSFYYPRDYCPKCRSRELEVRESRGVGSVFSMTKFRDRDNKEIYYGIVELEEGFRMYANFIVPVEIGDMVRVKFLGKESKVPFFEKI